MFLTNNCTVEKRKRKKNKRNKKSVSGEGYQRNSEKKKIISDREFTVEYRGHTEGEEILNFFETKINKNMLVTLAEEKRV